jgi:predicted permease
MLALSIAAVRDIRYSLRLLSKRPGWTFAAILCLGIATGANTAAFTLVNGLLLRPLPFHHPEQLAMVALREPGQIGTHPFALREYRQLAAAAEGEVGLIASTYFPLSVASPDGVRLAEAQLVSGNYFETLGVTPSAGRFFDASADRRGPGLVTVLSHAFWQRRFAGDRSVIGRSVRINGLPATVVAIAPDGFVGATQLIAADLWLPAAAYPTLAGSPGAENVATFGVMGRLKPGASRAAAQSRLAALVASQLGNSGRNAVPTVVVVPAAGFGVPPAAQGSIVTVSGFIIGLMGLLMSVAAANVAALVLARGAGRTREIGIRLALGASRGRIARQLLTESLVLAVAGNLVGAVAAVWITQAGVAHLTTPFSYVTYAFDVRPDLRVFAFTAVATGITAALCGLAPIRYASRIDLVEILKRSLVTGGGRVSVTTLNVIVVAQFAVSTTLVATAGLLVRSYINAQNVSLSYDTSRLMTASADLGSLHLDAAATERFYVQVVEQLRSLPNVQDVALTREAPLSVSPPPVPVSAEGSRRGASDSSGPFPATEGIVSSNYFHTIGVVVKEGSDDAFGRGSRTPAAGVAIVNETMARRLALDGSAVGRHFRVDGDGRQLEVVAVVPDLVNRLADSRVGNPMFYEPFGQRHSPRMTVLIRAQAAPATLVRPVEEAFHALQPDIAVETATVDARLETAHGQRRVPAAVLSVVCALALLLSAVGLYGVVAYGVRESAREIGIRLALGATPNRVQRRVLGRGLRLVSIGMLIGGVASLGVARLIQGALFGITARDPLTMLVVSSVLFATGSLALYLPARWAAHLDPAHTLRAD